MSNLSVSVHEPRTCAVVKNGKDQIVSSFKLTDLGYQGEIFLPFAIMPKLGNAIASGNEISFSITFGDCDDRSSVTIVRVSNVNYPSEDNKLIPDSMGKLKCA